MFRNSQLIHLAVLCAGILLFSCSKDSSNMDSEPNPEPQPEKFWDIQLDGQEFTVQNPFYTAYYESFSGALVVVGSKSFSSEERIVFTFSASNATSFTKGDVLDMDFDSGNSLLYFTNQNDRYSSHYLNGAGSFIVDQFIETDSFQYLSGSVEGVLFNEQDSTQVTVEGDFGINIGF